MRKLVLTLVVAMIGVIGTTATHTSAVIATTLTISYNDTRFVSFEVTRQPTVAQVTATNELGSTILYAKNLGKVR